MNDEQTREAALSSLHSAIYTAFDSIEAERAFWERKYRALEVYCFRKLIPEFVDVFAAVTGSTMLCRHDDMEVSTISAAGFNANGFWAKCRKCDFIIADGSDFPPASVILEEIAKLRTANAARVPPAPHAVGPKAEGLTDLC